jgi:hypothetical protein
MLRLDLRPAKLNQDHKGKATEKDGVVTQQLTFGVEDIPVDEHEIAVITGEKTAARAMYDYSDGVPRPLFTCFKPYEIDGSIDHAYVKVRVSGGEEFEFVDSKLTKVRFKPQVGGQTLMSMKVTSPPALTEAYARLVAQFGHTVDIEIRGDLPTDQQDLPLNTHGTGEQSDKAKPRGRGRRAKGNGHRPSVQ